MSRTARTFLLVFLSGICCTGSIAAEPGPSPGFEEAMALYRAGRAADAAAPDSQFGKLAGEKLGTAGVQKN